MIALWLIICSVRQKFLQVYLSLRVGLVQPLQLLDALCGLLEEVEVRSHEGSSPLRRPGKGSLRDARHPASAQLGVRLSRSGKQGQAELPVGIPGDDLGEDRWGVVVTDDQEVARSWIHRDPGVAEVGVNDARFVFLVVVDPQLHCRFAHFHTRDRTDPALILETWIGSGLGEAGPKFIERGRHGVGHDHGEVSSVGEGRLDVESTARRWPQRATRTSRLRRTWLTELLRATRSSSGAPKTERPKKP